MNLLFFKGVSHHNWCNDLKMTLPVRFIQYTFDLLPEVPINSQPFKTINHTKTSIYIQRINRRNWKKIKIENNQITVRDIRNVTKYT